MDKKRHGKKYLALLLIFTAIFVMCSCGSNKEQTIRGFTVKDDSIVEISEGVFLTQVEDIYINAEDYLGRKIKYQGIFQTFPYGEGEDSEQIVYVFRNSPGCCGNDGTAGFEILWDGEMPPEDSWVEVEGTLVSYEDSDGNRFLQVQVDSLQVLEERGKEFVSQ